MTERGHGVVIAGAGSIATELLAAGVDDFVVFDRDVVSSVFDDHTDSWTLATGDGETCRGLVVIAGASPLSRGSRICSAAELFAASRSMRRHSPRISSRPPNASRWSERTPPPGS